MGPHRTRLPAVPGLPPHVPSQPRSTVWAAVPGHHLEELRHRQRLQHLWPNRCGSHGTYGLGKKVHHGHWSSPDE